MVQVSPRQEAETSPPQRRRPPVVQDLQRLWSAIRRGGFAFLRWVARLWRSSLQLRVVSLTMLLGLVMVLLVGSYLYQRIADGLVQARVSSAKQEAAQQTRTAQARFSAADRTDRDSLKQLAGDIVQASASPGEDNSREVVLTRAFNNERDVVVPTVTSGGSGNIGLPTIPMASRQQLVKDSTHQAVQLITVLGDDDRPVPAVLVGSRVDVPTAGAYDLYFVFPMESEEATLAVVKRTFNLGGVALILLVGAVAWVVTRLAVEPIRRTAHVSERLASGALDERMRVRGADDLARLATSFNAMADSLQSQIRQLEDLSRVQQRFVSDVSHELRTPLTTIRMAADLLHGYRSEFAAPAARSTELLNDELDRFEALLADLLEISRFDAGAAALDLEDTDLRHSVTRVVQVAEPLARRRGSTLEVHTADRPCTAEVDARRIERILRNLVVNAVEHGEGRPITIRVGVNDSAVAVMVRDRGVGLRPGDASRVFDRFWRADPARARTTGGTGLGLSISLEDARLHQGWLQAWGEPGQGSCFRLTLPRHAGEPIVESPLPMDRSPARGRSS